jgi:hypothetical protein
MQRDIVFKAAILTAIVFIIGVSVGVWLDVMRVQEIKESLTEIDISWNDARLLSVYLQTLMNDTESCNSALEANLDFNNRIYQEGLKIERYETSERFAPSLILENRRYALLQLQFWLNSINLKKLCNANYSTLVYFFSHDENIASEQNIQSAVLKDVKEKCGADLMLIPLPFNLDIITIDLVKKNYNITRTPSILINEKIVLQGLQSEKDLAKYIPCLK